MTITLTPEIEKALVEAASKTGTTAELLALDYLRARFVGKENGAPLQGQETLADFLADYIGSWDSGEHIPGGAQMSEETGKKFAAGMLRKRKEGRL